MKYISAAVLWNRGCGSKAISEEVRGPDNQRSCIPSRLAASPSKLGPEHPEESGSSQTIRADSMSSYRASEAERKGRHPRKSSLSYLMRRIAG